MAMFLSFLEIFFIFLMAQALLRNREQGNIKFKINGIIYCSFMFVLPEAEYI